MLTPNDPEISPSIELEHVGKNFESRPVVSDCSFKLYPNHAYGLIGKSGAGKSTLLRLIVGIYVPSTGVCRLLGEQTPRLTEATLTRLGYVHQEEQLIAHYDGTQFFKFIRPHYTHWNDALLAGILERLEVPMDVAIGKMSSGERQCLAMAAALVHEPDVLIVDEPTNALDAFRREQVIQLLIEYMGAEGKTLLVSSHLLSDLDRIVDHLLVLHESKVICDAPLEETKTMFLRMVVWASERELRACDTRNEILSLHNGPSSCAITVTRAGAYPIKLHAEQSGWKYEQTGVSLEEAFQLLVGHKSASALPKS